MSPNNVDPRMVTTVLRAMIRHENDVTSHRILWLLWLRLQRKDETESFEPPTP